MTNYNLRKLPAGIQSFKIIRKENFLYVDKTDIIWKLVTNGFKYNYLSRPRRFGKSLLVDTLQSYFEGKKELFEGLKIMSLEKEWKSYPVVRLDMSMADATPEGIRAYFDETFAKYETQYGITPRSLTALSNRFKNIIVAAYEQTGLQVAVLIDEYDAPLQHSWKTPEHKACTEVYRTVFSVLKNADEYEKLVFHHRHHQVHSDFIVLGAQQSDKHQFLARIYHNLRYYRRGNFGKFHARIGENGRIQSLVRTGNP